MAAKVFGVTTRFTSHAQAFDLVFFEVKGIAGAFRDAPAGTVPSISAFADEKVARAHPDWVQVGPGGERAERGTRYFDWSSLCPSRPEVFDLGVTWAKRAAQGARGLRLDDAHFARQGYCQCPVCVAAAERAGMTLSAFRRMRTTQYARCVRSEIGGPLYYTVHPDPYPGHLEDHYGVDVDALGEIADGFVVPIYDMAYSTTYWVEVLASGFRERLSKPFFVELYGLDVAEDRLVKAAEVAQHYADGILIAYDRDLERLQRIRGALRS